MAQRSDGNVGYHQLLWRHTRHRPAKRNADLSWLIVRPEKRKVGGSTPPLTTLPVSPSYLSLRQEESLYRKCMRAISGLLGMYVKAARCGWS